MKVWWLALDRQYTSFKEVKARQAIAQGWPQIGDLSSFTQIASEGSRRGEFEEIIEELSADAYGADSRELRRAPGVMWNLMRIEKGDLLVALEGTAVCGLAEASEVGWRSYQYDGQFHYAQTVATPTTWIDWDTSVAVPPVAPAQSVLGIRGLNKDRGLVERAWARFAPVSGTQHSESGFLK